MGSPRIEDEDPVDWDKPLHFKATVVEPYMNNEVPLDIFIHLTGQGMLVKVEVETWRGKVEAKRELP